MLDAPELAVRLKTAMRAAGVSSAELARRCGVSPQAVYEWRDTGRIAKKHLPMIAATLGLALNELLLDVTTVARAHEPDRAPLRYALRAAFPELTDEDVQSVLAYAMGIADTRRRVRA